MISSLLQLLLANTLSMFKLHPFHSYQMCKKIHRNPISVSAQNLINDQREGREGAEVASVEVSSQVWTFHIGVSDDPSNAGC